MTELPGLNLIGHDWDIYPDPITVARRNIIRIGSYVQIWPTWTERVLLKEKCYRGCWVGTNQRKMNFYYADKYGTELANEHSKTR